MRCALIPPLCALLLTSACTKKEASVSPDEAPPASAEADPEPPPPPPEASPELIAAYTATVHEVYARDAERCLEEQMEAEDTRYMRSAYSLKISVADDGTTTDANTSSVMVQVRNYEGEVLREGNAESMSECLVKAASEWEFEPAPPSATSFEVTGSVGD